jgi:hypothetical protein
LHHFKPKDLTDLPILSQIYWIPLVSAVAFYFVRKTIKATANPFFVDIVKDQDDKELKQARIEKASLLIYKMMFYTMSSVWCYLLFMDSDMMPSWLGGAGSVPNLFKKFPYGPQHPGLLLYSLVQMGYVIEEIFEHNFLAPRTNDFWEMNFHDLLSLALYGSMIITNTIMLGAMVSLIHNMSDIPTTVTRALSQTVYKKATIITFVVNLLTWVAGRNLMMPVLVFACWKYLILPSEFAQFQPAISIMCFFLSLLCCLHVYWLVMFIKILYVGMTTGSTENTLSKVVKTKAQ